MVQRAHHYIAVCSGETITEIRRRSYFDKTIRKEQIKGLKMNFKEIVRAPQLVSC